MLKLEEFLPKFIATIKHSKSYSSTQFSLNYDKNEIRIYDASSSFLKHLYSQPKVCAHLHKGYISVTYFVG